MKPPKKKKPIVEPVPVEEPIPTPTEPTPTEPAPTEPVPTEPTPPPAEPAPVPTEPAPTIPVARFTANVSGLFVLLDAASSVRAVSYAWDLGLEVPGVPRYVTGNPQTVTYPHPDDRTVVLTITADDGNQYQTKATFPVGGTTTATSGESMLITMQPPVTQPPAPTGGGGGELYPNRPSGMTLLTQWDGTQRGITGDMPVGWYDPILSESQATIQADGGGVVNPLGTGSSLKINYPNGTNSVGNNNPQGDWGGDWKKLYISYRIWIQPGWDTSIGQKLFYIRQAGDPAVNDYYFVREAGGAFKGQNNFSGGPNFCQDFSFWTGVEGSWVNVEILLEAETAYNSSNDARCRVWKNGVLAADESGFGPLDNMTGMELYLTRNSNHTQDEYFLIGEIRVDGAAA